MNTPVELPCGAVFKNRLAKSAMSDSLADGTGNPTETQIRLYEKWAEGGTAISFIGEVQGDPRYPEKPGNLVLGPQSVQSNLQLLTQRARVNDTHLWPQIGHAGALSYLPVSKPKGPSPLDLDGLQCEGLSVDEIQQLPEMYARTAAHAKSAGFSGVHIHAGHGFLLSQFLSPLFNHRQDQYGGSIEARCQIIIEIINKVRDSVGHTFPIGIRINSSDQLEGGLTEIDSLEAIGLLDQTSIDLIDISGGTYFPGAKASSEGVSQGPYFLEFARQARSKTQIPVMLTGGFKHRAQAIAAIDSGAVDIIGLARAMVLYPRLPEAWISESGGNLDYPQFQSPPPGGITAWYTMRLTALGENREMSFDLDLPAAMRHYEERDAQRTILWNKTFNKT
ncbi:MAG: hypothetical protein KTR18_15410 [Acidiferrobacterales bacterium]|nr:hypothetical protein [Acidiferrobacterales bacterium]